MKRRKSLLPVLSYHIGLGCPLKNLESYGLQVHLDSARTVQEVKIVD